MEAHQFKIRKQKAVEESISPYWEGLGLDLSKTIIKQVDYKVAEKIILEYEWLKCMPAIVKYCYGIFFDDVCGGVVVFSNEYSENTGVWDKYEFTNKMILLSRGVCLHWTPKNTGSKLIMGAIKLLPKEYEVVTCTVDELAGEVGTIYQACNFIYTGVMRKRANRLGVLIDGKTYGSRTIRKRIGTIKKEEILKHWPNAEFITQKSKARYFLFRKNQKKHLNSIKDLIKPYPKRG